MVLFIILAASMVASLTHNLGMGEWAPSMIFIGGVALAFLVEAVQNKDKSENKANAILAAERKANPTKALYR